MVKLWSSALVLGVKVWTNLTLYHIRMHAYFKFYKLFSSGSQEDFERIFPQISMWNLQLGHNPGPRAMVWLESTQYKAAFTAIWHYVAV